MLVRTRSGCSGDSLITPAASQPEQRSAAHAVPFPGDGEEGRHKHTQTHAYTPPQLSSGEEEDSFDRNIVHRDLTVDTTYL